MRGKVVSVTMFLLSISLLIYVNLCSKLIWAQDAISSSDSVLGFERSYDNSFSDWVFDLIQVQDNGYVLLGVTEEDYHNQNIWLVRTDQNGELLWTKTYGGEGDEWAGSIIQTVDGGCAFICTTELPSSSESDLWLVKTDAEGNMQWNKTYGGTDCDSGLSIIQTSGGGYLIAGNTMSFGNGNSSLWLIKTDTSGNIQWNKTYGEVGWHVSAGAEALVEASDGGYAVAGHISKSFDEHDYIWLVKTDIDGNMLWNKTYSWGQSCSYPQLISTGDGGFALAGYNVLYPSPGKSRSQIMLIKTDGEGEVEWNRIHGDPDFVQQCYSIIEVSDNGFILVGKNWSTSGHYGTMIKVDTNGDITWVRTFPGPITGATDAGMTSIIRTSDDGYAISGNFYANIRGHDFWLVKTDSFGDIPEFPSFLILSLFMTATLLIVIVYRRKYPHGKVCAR